MGLTGSIMAMVVLMSALSAFAAGESIRWDVTNVGGSVWQYDYYFDGFDFRANQEVRIEFDWATCSDLVLPDGAYDSLLAQGWDAIVASQPQPSLLDYGIYGALALVDDPGYEGPFSVQFTWSGDADPGAQGFELRQWNDDWSFDVVSTGRTGSPAGSPVPEPASGLLLAGGVLALGGYAWKRR
jgi:hypothetical protein